MDDDSGRAHREHVSRRRPPNADERLLGSGLIKLPHRAYSVQDHTLLSHAEGLVRQRIGPDAEQGRVGDSLPLDAERRHAQSGRDHVDVGGGAHPSGNGTDLRQTCGHSLHHSR